MTTYLFVLKNTDDSNWVGPVILFSLFGWLLYFLILKNLKKRDETENPDLYANDGNFPIDSPYSERNLHLAYTALAARLMMQDRQSFREKQGFLAKYFHHHFPNSNLDFKQAMVDVFRSPVTIQSTAQWLDQNVHEPDDKLKVIYFLAGLAMVDGDIRDEERIVLNVIAEECQISIEKIEEVIRMYDRYEEAEREQDIRDFERKNLKSRAMLSYNILGLEPGTDFNTIKSTYRKMVKQYHPDRMIHASDEDQKIAHQKFIQVQKAYEILEALLNPKD